MRRLSLALLLTAAFAGGYVAGSRKPAAQAGQPGPHPEVIEVHRHQTAGEPLVAETLRVLSVHTATGAAEFDAPRAGKPRWTVRTQYAGAVTTYECEGLTSRP